MNRGKMSESALKRSVLKRTAEYNKNSGAGIGVDAGSYETAAGKRMMSTAALIGEERGNGELCVIRAVNSLTAAGGWAEAAAISLMVPENDPEDFAKRITDEAVRACKRCGIELVSGNTVLGSEAAVTAVVTGERRYVLSTPSRDVNRILIMTGTAGNAGAAMLAEQKHDVLAARLTEDFIGKAVSGFKEIASFESAAEIAASTDGKAAIHDISEGGVFGAIWELLERENLGCTVELKEIPIRQAVIEVCEILDVSPYQLRGDGGLVAVVEDTPANRMLGKVIGRIENTADRVIINGGERRFLEPNRFDPYYDIRLGDKK